MKKKTELVTWEIMGHKIEVNPDEQWEEILSEDDKDQKMSLIDTHIWMIQLDGIDRPLSEKKEFWKYFSDDDAGKERERAVMGIKSHNEQDYIKLLNDALEFDDKRKSGRFKELGTDRMKTSALVLAMQFSELIARRNHKELRRLADIMQRNVSEKTEQSAETNKGGKYSLKGQIIEVFCHIAKAKRDLPTKNEIREQLSIRYEDRSEYEKFRISLNSLGLKGLPSS